MTQLDCAFILSRLPTAMPFCMVCPNQLSALYSTCRMSLHGFHLACHYVTISDLHWRATLISSHPLNPAHKVVSAICTRFIAITAFHTWESPSLHSAAIQLVSIFFSTTSSDLHGVMHKAQVYRLSFLCCRSESFEHLAGVCQGHKHLWHFKL